MLSLIEPRNVLLVLAAICAMVVGLYLWVFADLPDPSSLSLRGNIESTKILDRNGYLLYETPGQDEGKRTRLRLDEFPAYLKQATIATEDATFYDNPGVDVVGITRALIANVRGGEVVAGGSTITQQVIRASLMSAEERGERSLRRKVREAVMALALARLYTKDAVLEAYLNEAYYGNMAYGAEAAAQAYFGKPARDLDLAESALLAGLTQSPANYNPLLNLAAARSRQATVLDLMVSNGFIAKNEAEMAKSEDLRFAPAPFDIKAPHFVAYVKDILDREFADENGERRGLRVITTLDYSFQSVGQEIIRTQLARLKDDDVSNAALVAIDPRTGEILAMVGSADYFAKEIDGAVNIATSPRQPGSSIKPITYAAAFARGWSPATVVADVRTAFPTREGTPFVPANYDYIYHGPVSLRQALGSSINVPAVKVLEYVGLPAFVDFAHDLGITSLSDDSQYGLSLTLGGGEVTLLELSSAFGVLANSGIKQPPRAILRIEDNRGKVLYRSNPGPSQQVIDPRVAFLISDVLSDDSARRLTFGSYSPLRIGRQAAVKTGTTSSWRDNWTVGYTPDLVVGAWAGNADGRPMKNVSGVTGAAPIWHDFMEEVGKVRPSAPFVEPAGLVRVDVCPESGELPGPYCPYRRQEVFIAGTESKGTCTIHQKVRICSIDNTLATPDCPTDQVVEKVFTVLPAEMSEWSDEVGLARPPSEYYSSGKSRDLGGQIGSLDPRIRVTSPDNGSVYTIDPSFPAEVQRIGIAAAAIADPAAVRLIVDGMEISTLRQRPYSSLWRLVEGEHTIAAIALDDAGGELARSEVHITVVNR